MSSQQALTVESVFKQAEAFRESGEIEKSLQEYTKVVYHAPEHWPAYFHLGTIFGSKGHHALAVSLLKRAEKINPTHAVIKNHLADFLRLLSLFEEAKNLLKASWELDSKPTNLSALYKIGSMLWEGNQPSEALNYFSQVVDIGSDLEETKDLVTLARWYRSLCYLSLGEFEKAWPDYEIRNNIPGVVVPDLNGVLWQGEDLKGKRLFLVYEQRFGDILQFVRYVPRLIELGAQVMIQLPPELSKQISCSFPDAQIVLTTDKIPEYDYYQFLTSIPAVLNLNKEQALAEKVPYLDFDREAIKSPLPLRPGTRIRVGLVWAGKPEPDRSINLKYFTPLLEHNEVSFFSFQLGEQRKQLSDNAMGWLVQDLAPHIKDFHDSSVLLSQMDLLITIDTAIAHQAGALGMPVWMMLKFHSDWRWGLDRSDNDWYPSMKIFRQHTHQDWDSAANSLYEAFSAWVTESIK